MRRLDCCRIRSGAMMAINTKGKDYIIHLYPLMHKVELYNMQSSIRLDSFEVMRLLMQMLIHNSIEVIQNDKYYRAYKSDKFDELLVELSDDFYLEYGLGHDIDYRFSDDKLVSYKLDLSGELVLSIKRVISVVHEDLDDLLGEGDAP